MLACKCSWWGADSWLFRSSKTWDLWPVSKV
jgi:hypothetical protein